MSTVSHVFIQGEFELSKVVDAMTELLGHRMEPEDVDIGTLFTTWIFNLDVSVYDEHGYEEDMGVDFTKYQYAIEFKRWAGDESELRVDLCRLLSKLTGSVISRTLDCHCIVVDDLQVLVQSFP